MVLGMAKGEEWTGEELEKLKALYTSDASFEEVVDELPLRSPNAIRLKASRPVSYTHLTLPTKRIV